MEKSNDIGGLWRYRDDDYGVMQSTYINISKQNYCYSDHPFDDNVPDFPHHTVMLDYIRSYARRFMLEKHINFEKEVLFVDGWLFILLLL